MLKKNLVLFVLMMVFVASCGGSSGSGVDDNTNSTINDNTNQNVSPDPDAGVNNNDPGVDAGPCEADCTGRVCGDDGCGGECGPGCGADESCNADGQCDTPLYLFNPNNQGTAYLINRSGQTVHQWSGMTSGGYSVYLLDNGNILRPAHASNTYLGGGAEAGLVQEVNPSAQVVWQFEYNSTSYLTHHDIEPMPNGNVLLIAWEVKSAQEASAAGRTNASEMWPDHIIEVQPSGSSGGTIVWEWHAWDHLIQDANASADNYGVVADHPELLDVNLGQSSGGPPGPGGSGGDWLHINAVSYNPTRDEIVISSHFLNEFYVIDHSTTTAEAAGHTGGNRGQGGDILYRWGNPNNYASGTQIFNVVHCSWWVGAGLPGAGNIMAFNNGATGVGGASSVVEVTPPLDGSGNYELSGGVFGPSAATWTYSNGSTFYSEHLGGVQRLANGNTFIVESTSGYMFEVTTDGQVVWDYQASSEVARALRYEADHPGVGVVLNN